MTNIKYKVGWPLERAQMLRKQDMLVKQLTEEKFYYGAKRYEEGINKGYMDALYKFGDEHINWALDITFKEALVKLSDEASKRICFDILEATKDHVEIKLAPSFTELVDDTICIATIFMKPWKFNIPINVDTSFINFYKKEENK